MTSANSPVISISSRAPVFVLHDAERAIANVAAAQLDLFGSSCKCV
jgi:hypothetical protein